ncbi:MAG: disulfide bond formation protein B [Microthrixaceae bacterium]
MNQDVFDTFYAMLTVAGQLALAGLGVLWLLRHRVPWWARVRTSVAPVALWLATLVATVAMLGSLQLSLGAGYTPCTLCWYQRIAIYPLVVVCGVAALPPRRRRPLHGVAAGRHRRPRSPPGTTSTSGCRTRWGRAATRWRRARSCGSGSCTTSRSR